VEIIGAFGIEIKAVGSHNGPDTQVVQLRLEQLGFWSGGSDGQYGFATVQAVMAFQKYLGLPATGKVDQGTAAYLQAFPEKAHGRSDSGTLVEVDKGRQLLFVVVDGKTVWTFNTSTGSGIPYEAVNKKDPTKIEKGDAVTPSGLWKVTRERPEGWWEGDLGKIYRPKYFHGGVAIHGMTSVPNYPASHGCVRVSTQAMDFIWATGLVPVGTPVWVHE
jgi:lipoprotein-anchoring transpeptidase ErfK/SrfK